MGYFYTFKMHFEWMDRDEEIVSCDVSSKEKDNVIQYITTIALTPRSRLICLLKGDFEMEMPKENFRYFILDAAERWMKKNTI